MERPTWEVIRETRAVETDASGPVCTPVPVWEIRWGRDD